MCNMYIYISSTHSSVIGHLGCFHLLVIMNSAAINMGGQIFFKDTAFNYLYIYPAVAL